MRKKLVKDKVLLGTLLTDELHSDFGSSARTLFSTNEDTGHYFFRSGLTINTAPGGAGTALEEGVDFLLNNELESFSDEATIAIGSPVQIYRTVQITNVTYQSGDLYFTYYGHGDSVQGSVQNRNTSWTLEKDAAYTIDDAVYGDVTVLATAGAGGWSLKTPDATLNKHARVEVVKVDTGAGLITITNDHGQTYNVLANIVLYNRGDSAIMISDGANWIVIKRPLIMLDSAALANSQVQTLAHGLGVKPSIAQVSLLCISTELGYAAGDEVVENPNYAFDATVQRYGVGFDATNFTTLTGSGGLVICRKDNGVGTAADETKWKFRIRYI